MSAMVRLVFLAAVVSILAPCVARAQAPTASCTFRGRISDPLGAAISRGFVLVHNQRWTRGGQQLTLNDNGEFTVQLRPGLYDLLAASPGFIPIAKEIDLRSCKPVVPKIKLKVDLAHLDD